MNFYWGKVNLKIGHKGEDNMLQEKIELLQKRREILQLNFVDISNKEWLYMLGEETRNSIMIEGIFVDEDELSDALVGKYRSASHVVNYFRTAKFFYNLAIELYKSNENYPCVAVVKATHKMLFDGIIKPQKLGMFRVGRIKITGAKIEPPEYDIDDWIRLWCTYTEYVYFHHPIYEATARSHVLFESIHPFEDGNGRIGRILLNFYLLKNGYINITIKGVDQSERTKYITALEKAEEGIRNIFKHSPKDFTPEDLDKMFTKEQTKKLSSLIFEQLIRAIDNYICSTEEMIDVNEASKVLGIKPDSVLKMIKRGKLIATKKGKKWWIAKKYVKLLIAG